MARRTLEVQIVGDSRSLDRALGRSQSRLQKFGGIAKKAGLAVGAGLAVETVRAVNAWREAEKVGRQTEAVIKSTGGAAQVSAKQVEGLANSISLKAGIDDEAIQSGENLLLTFKNIRNETGAGNQIFSQATRTIVDMSVAMDQGMKQSAIQVGKALNDPVKGMTALSRVGVTFSETQKTTIERLVESGRRMDAQKIILRELRSEFGGSAAAQADAFDKAKVAVENLEESLGGLVGPALASVAGGLAKFVNQLRTGTGFGGRFRDAIVSAFERVRAVVGTVVSAVSGWLRRNRDELRALGNAFVDIGRFVRNAFEGVVLPVLRRVLPGIVTMFKGWANLIKGVVQVVAGILTLDFRKAWDGVKSIFRGALQTVLGAVRAFTAPFREMISRIAGVIGNIFGAAWRRLRAVVSGVTNAIKGFVRGMGKVIGDVIAFILRGFAKFFEMASKVPILGDKFDGLAEDANNLADEIDKMGESTSRATRKFQRQNAVLESLRSAANAVAGAFNTVAGSQRNAAGGPTFSKAQLMAGLLPTGGQLSSSSHPMHDVAARFGLSSAGPGQRFRPGDPGFHGRGRAADYSGSASGMLAFARFLANSMGSRLLELIHTPLGFSIDNYRRVPPFAQADHYDHVHVAMRHGGRVGGAGSGDRIPALLEPGEFVLNRNAVGAVGPGFLQALNERIARFREGGLVGANLAADAARKAGFKGKLLRLMIAISGGESGGWNPRAHNTAGEDSRGLWQINVGPGANTDLRGMNLFDPYVNARAAMTVFKRQGLGAWTVYTSGAYRSYMDEARAALLATRDGRQKAKRRGKGDRKRKGAGLVLVPGSGGVYTTPAGRRKLKRLRKGQAGGTVDEEPVDEGAEEDTAAADLAAAIQANTDAINAMNAEMAQMRRYAQDVNRVTGLEAMRALSDVVSGQIFGHTDQRGRGAGYGAAARY